MIAIIASVFVHRYEGNGKPTFRSKLQGHGWRWPLRGISGGHHLLNLARLKDYRF